MLLRARPNTPRPALLEARRLRGGFLDHTNFVGRPSWGFAAWTHNSCGDDDRFYADHPFHLLIRDNTSGMLLFMGRIDDPTQLENELVPTVDHVLGDNDLFGDSNHDGRFDPLDIVTVLRAGKYLTGAAATFEQGDWNGDSVFDRFDIVEALQTGTYLQTPAATADSP